MSRLKELLARWGRHHYTSTYCVHGLHWSCRLTYKHCGRSCRCRCHQ